MWNVYLRGFIFVYIGIVVSMNQRDRDWGPNPTVFNIGGVLSNNESERYFNETISVSESIFSHSCCKNQFISKMHLLTIACLLTYISVSKYSIKD